MAGFGGLTRCVSKVYNEHRKTSSILQPNNRDDTTHRATLKDGLALRKGETVEEV